MTELTPSDEEEENESKFKSLVEIAKSIKDIILAIPRKIVAIIKRVFTAIYAYWSLVIRTVFKFIYSIISIISNGGVGIVNFFQEFLSIVVGVFA